MMLGSCSEEVRSPATHTQAHEARVRSDPGTHRRGWTFGRSCLSAPALPPFPHRQKLGTGLGPRLWDLTCLSLVNRMGTLRSHCRELVRNQQDSAGRRPSPFIHHIFIQLDSGPVISEVLKIQQQRKRIKPLSSWACHFTGERKTINQINK